MTHKKAIINDYSVTEAGTYLVVHIPDWAPKYNLADHCELRFDDGRQISVDQRRLLYALFRDISWWSGHDIEEIKTYLKIDFMIDCKQDYFSLANTDMTTARKFIEYVLEFVFKHAIPLKHKVKNLAKEVNNYLYLCIVNRSCAECGNYADIHHADAIGMGRDRSGIDHAKHKLIALCRKHHNEVHSIGWLTFREKYHLDGIKVDAETIKRIGMK